MLTRDDEWGTRERRLVLLFELVVLGAVLWPVRQHARPAAQRVDGFPLSYYPMFSKQRRQHANVVFAVGVDMDGGRRRLRHSLLGHGGLNQVRRQLYRMALTEDRPAELATALARRLVASPACADLVKVQVVRGEFDLDACLLNRNVTGVEIVLAEAQLERGSTPLEIVSAEDTVPGLVAVEQAAE
jgi:hypothetical protein